MARLPNGPFRFFALDVETANHNRASICQVGVACVRPDNRIETWVTLVNPQTDHWVFSGLHGITAQMVKEAPTIGEVIKMLDTCLAGRTVYQHSGFDRSAFRAACFALGRSEPDWNWQNSVRVARAAWPELKGNGGHGLASLKAHLGLSFVHHDAGEDARVAAEVVLLAQREMSAESIRVDLLEGENTFPLSPSTRCTPSQTGTEMSSKAVIGRSVLSQGNLNNNHFSVRSFLSAFPADVIGGPNRQNAAPRNIQICWEGTPPISTDIDGEKAILRDRAWVRRFFERHVPQAGDVVEVSEIGPYSYRVALSRT